MVAREPREAANRPRSSRSPQSRSEHPRTRAVASDKGPGPGDLPGKPQPCLSRVQRQADRVSSEAQTRKAKSLPRSGQARPGHNGTGPSDPWPAAWAAAGRSSCPGSPRRRPAPRDPRPPPPSFPRTCPGSHPAQPQPVPPAAGPREASARLRQGYEVHGEEDERATVEEREDEHHRLHPPPPAPLLQSNRFWSSDPPGS